MIQQSAFDPMMFLQLADELASDTTDEAALRTAVGRAYYAVYLLARAQTSVRGRHQAHERVREELSPRNPRLAALLGTMSSLRLMADYDLQLSNAQIQDWRRIWQNARQQATYVLDELDNLANQSS